jgi:hypothetical protein
VLGIGINDIFVSQKKGDGSMLCGIDWRRPKGEEMHRRREWAVPGTTDHFRPNQSSKWSERVESEWS